MAKYLTSVYVSGWQCSSTASTSNEPGPDVADYPYDTVPNKARVATVAAFGAALTARQMANTIVCCPGVDSESVGSGARIHGAKAGMALECCPVAYGA